MSGVRHPWFDPWLMIGGWRLRQVVNEVRRDVALRENRAGVRKRKRRPVDQHNHEVGLEAVIANMAYAVLCPRETGTLAIITGKAHLSKRTRYDHPMVGRKLPYLLGALEEAGVLHWSPSRTRGMASELRPTAAFAARVRATEADLSEFNPSMKEETIILSEKVKGPVEGGVLVNRRLVDYEDTAQTVEFRDDLLAMNRSVSAAHITFLDDGRGQVDVHSRRQRRYFKASSDAATPQFDKCGRFYGGFWQNLKSDRRASIRLQGEPLSLLDFSSMFPRLAYARLGKEPPTGDLYAIPGLEGHRSGVKRAMNCFLFDGFTRRSHWPKDMDAGEGRWLPPEWTVGAAKKAIAQHHPALASLFGTGIGDELMMAESVIMATILRELRGRGIVALGLHDGLMVPRSRGSEAHSVMVEVGSAITKTPLPVSIKQLGTGSITGT